MQQQQLIQQFNQYLEAIRFIKRMCMKWSEFQKYQTDYTSTNIIINR